MPSEKFFVHKEDGSLVRLKGRLVRFLDEEPPTGSDKSAIRTALEVSPDAEGLVQADVGTGPQNLVLHQHLGDLAYQSAEGISVGTLEAESLEVTDKITTKDVGGVTKGQVEFQDSSYTISGGSNLGDIRQDAPRHRFYSGSTILAQIDEGTSYFQNTSVGINQTSPSTTANAIADDLVVGNTGQFSGITVVSGTGSQGSVFFNSGSTTINGGMAYEHPSNSLQFVANGATRWIINSSGNLAATGAYGIDFGQATPNAGGGTGTTGTPQSSVLSDYEVGSWTPTFSSVSATFSYTTQSGRYVKVGKQVTAQFYLLATASGTTSNAIKIYGLPFVASAVSGTGFDQFAAASWFTGSNAIQWLTSSNTAEMIGWAQNSGPSTRTAADVSGQYIVGTLTYEATT